ncbi:hypothetical protein ACIBKY_44455 [Nonomuraea sp. NPDC050394]|uniref:hypothetical protein n=1 Tax=Nonomuraea sp. NPDC050394 TaxID=3364363 RepID=UPI0037A5BAB6
MNTLRVIALSAAALALAGCTTPRASPPPTAQTAATHQPATSPPAQEPVPASPSASPARALPKPTATTGPVPRPRPKICDRRGVHRVPAPDVLSINEIALDGNRVIVKAKPTIMVCGPKVDNDAYFEPVPGPAKTYRLTCHATVILVDMSDGPRPAHYGAAAFVKLLRATPELSVDHGNLDPHFRAFHTATFNSSDGTEITMLAQHYHP